MSRAPAAFTAALAAEHAAVFGYGVVGAKGDKAVRDAARIAEAAHRIRRDALVVRFANGGATPPPAEPAYALPFPVTDRAGALRLAIHLEDRTGVAWRDVLADTDGDDRKTALDAYIDCAVRAVRWRRLAGVRPVTLTFPGAPET